MAISVTSSPPYPVVAKGAKLTFTPGGGGNYARVWCVDAPDGSKLKTSLQNDALSRVEIFAGEAIESSPPFLFQPDKPGVYVLVVQEYQRGASTYGGGYAGDPRGFDTETKIGSESTVSLAFGQRWSMQMGIAPDTATLVLYVFGDTVRATTFALHGERTPAIVNPSSDAARTAALSLDFLPTVDSQVYQLVDQTAASIAGDLDTITTNMFNVFAGHFGNTAGSVHATGDTYNVPNSSLGLPGSKKATVKTVGELVTALGLHMATDQARRLPFVSAGPGTGDWHNPSGAAVTSDGPNTLLSTQPATMEQAYIALAELHLAYDQHGVSLHMHGAAESTYILAALPKLLNLHKLFLFSTKSRTPTPGATENPGAVTLVNITGGKLS